MILETRKAIWTHDDEGRPLPMSGSHRVSFSLLVAAALLALSITSGFANTVEPQTKPREGHALWAHPPDVGKTTESVRAFVAKCKRANIETIVMDIKGMAGEIY